MKWSFYYIYQDELHPFTTTIFFLSNVEGSILLTSLFLFFDIAASMSIDSSNIKK